MYMTVFYTFFVMLTKHVRHKSKCFRDIFLIVKDYLIVKITHEYVRLMKKIKEKVC